MTNTILTIISASDVIPATMITNIRAALDSLGGESGSPQWLTNDMACDIAVFDLATEQVDAAARTTLDDAPFDVIVQTACPPEQRRKKLLLADMDSTIVTGETLDDLAAFAGLKDKIAAITARAMNGELDFEAALKERVSMLKGLPLSALQETFATLTYTPGAKTLVQTMNALGATTALVSGGFTFFTERVGEACGFAHQFGNTLKDDGKALTGKVGSPILGREAKLETLMRLASENGLELTGTLTVGDGANDLDMLMAAGLGIAFHAKPAVRARAHAQINHTGLEGLLYAQGIHRDEFVN